MNDSEAKDSVADEIRALKERDIFADPVWQYVTVDPDHPHYGDMAVHMESVGPWNRLTENQKMYQLIEHTGVMSLPFEDRLSLLKAEIAPATLDRSYLIEFINPDSRYPNVELAQLDRAIEELRTPKRSDYDRMLDEAAERGKHIKQEPDHGIDR